MISLTSHCIGGYSVERCASPIVLFPVIMSTVQTYFSPCGESEDPIFLVYGLNFLCVRKKKPMCGLICIHSPPPGAISHSWHHAAGTLKLIGRAWRGYECYDWCSPGEIEFLLVVMKGPAGEHGWDNISIKTEEDTHTHTQTHGRYISSITTHGTQSPPPVPETTKALHIL